MIATCVSDPGHRRAAAAAAKARVARGGSGASVRPIVQTACATTATATTMRPCSQAACTAAPVLTRRANAAIAAADGRVKPIQAASAPAQPARSMPTAMPTWLLAGPGRSWHSATRSAYAAASSQRLRSTYSCRKYPRWAMGPPKEVRPRRRATPSTSRAEPIAACSRPLAPPSAIGSPPPSDAASAVSHPRPWGRLAVPPFGAGCPWPLRRPRRGVMAGGAPGHFDGGRTAPPQR